MDEVKRIAHDSSTYHRHRPIVPGSHLIKYGIISLPTIGGRRAGGPAAARFKGTSFIVRPP
jgi:hypothetical protein